VQRVVFPVDCIDHDPMQRLKRLRLRLRHGLPYQALRSASLAGFLAGVGQAACYAGAWTC